MYCKEQRTVYFAKCDWCGQTSGRQDHADEVAGSLATSGWDWYTNHTWRTLPDSETYHLCKSCLLISERRQQLDAMVSEVCAAQTSGSKSV